MSSHRALALLAAIFVSNFPEALVGSASMRAQGRSQKFILGTWLTCAVLLTLAVVVGAGPLSQTDPETISPVWAVRAKLSAVPAGGR